MRDSIVRLLWRTRRRCFSLRVCCSLNGVYGWFLVICRGFRLAFKQWGDCVAVRQEYMLDTSLTNYFRLLDKFEDQNLDTSAIRVSGQDDWSRIEQRGMSWPVDSSRNWCSSRQSSNKLERLSRRSTGGRRQVRRGTSDRRMYRSLTISTGLSDRCVSLSTSLISVVDCRRLRHKEYKTWLEERSLYRWYTNRQWQ